jgi:hypothetical protein
VALSGQSASFRLHLLALKARVVTACSLPASRVRITVEGSKPRYVGEQFVTVTPGHLLPHADAGAGRYGTDARRVVRVSVHTRASVDEAGSAEHLLTDAEINTALGHVALEEAVMDALHLHWLTYSDEETDETDLLIEPMRLLEDGSDGPKRPEVKDEGWAVSDLYFELRYVLPLTQRTDE